MDNKKQTEVIPSTADEDMWSSPFNPYHNSVKNDRRFTMSTPNIAPWSSLTSLEDSQGSSKQDSGYCSLTPSSTTPIFDGEFSVRKKCPSCSKLPRESYEPSPPASVCNCKKKYLSRKRACPPECMQTISECKSPINRKLASRAKLNPTYDLFDEVMDTSLYPEELDNRTDEAQNFQGDQIEIGEEKSIDFVDSSFFYLRDQQSQGEGMYSGENTENKNDEKMSFLPYGDVSPFQCSANDQKLATANRPAKFKSGAEKVVTMLNVSKLFINGIEQLDILYHLTNKTSCPHVVSIIFSYLSERDLGVVRNVSKVWKSIMMQDFAACKRWKLYKCSMRMQKENYMSPVSKIFNLISYIGETVTTSMLIITIYYLFYFSTLFSTKHVYYLIFYNYCIFIYRFKCFRL